MMFFLLGTGLLLISGIWTTYTGELKVSLVWAVWGGSLIIKDAIDDSKKVI